jgi:tetratricopeptide (TPR) repeat protein
MDITRLQQQATEYLVKGQYDEAIHLYEQCIQANPTERSNYWHLGLAWFLQGEELEAESVWLLAIIGATPENVDTGMAELVEVLEAQALQYLQVGNLQQAERIYWQILELDADRVQAYYNLGTALLYLDKLDEARTCLQRAVELKPDCAEAYRNLGYVLQRQESFEEAIFYHLKAWQFNPNWSDTHYQLGICFAKQDKLDEAIACFQKIITIKPDDTQAYCSWGEALLKQGKLDEAIACFNKTVQIKPKFALAYREWRDNLAKNGHVDDKINSRADFLKALQSQETSHYLYSYLGDSLAAIDNLCEAINCYKKAIEIKPDVTGYLKLGEVLAKNKQVEEAINSYKKALEINREAAEVYLNLGKVLVQQDNLDEAIAYCKKALEINPTLAEAQDYLETALQRKDKPDEATASLQNTSLAIPPKGVYRSTWDWAIQSGLEKSNYIKVDARYQNYLTQPITLDGCAVFGRKETEFASPESFVAVIPDGRVWFGKNNKEFAIISPDNCLLADISSGYRLSKTNKHPIFSEADLPPVHNIDGTVVIVPGKMGFNYFHWMIDIFPSIGLLPRSGIDISEIEKIFIDGYYNLQFHTESLKALGIPHEKIIDSTKYSEKYPYIKARRLVVTSPNQTARATKWSCEFLRNLFLNKNNIRKYEKKERWYISRGKANRQVINEDKLIVFLEKFGFKSVTLESLSVYEQASLLAAAEVVISPHGAGLTNTVFCSPKTKVIEIFSPHCVWPYYWVISNQVDLEYYSLKGEGLECYYLHQLMYPSLFQSDVLVNLDSLLDIMKLAGVV